MIQDERPGLKEKDRKTQGLPKEWMKDKDQKQILETVKRGNANKEIGEMFEKENQKGGTKGILEMKMQKKNNKRNKMERNDARETQ